jgi:riboflavin kinase / FMN adenylyltransferase
MSMRVIAGLCNWPSGERCGAMTIGVFDGVHKGHQEIVRRVVESAGGQASALLTFDPHPDRVIGKGDPLYLTTFEQKAEILDSLGLQNIIVEPFTLDLANTAPQLFIENIHSVLAPAHIVLGERSRFGRAGKGDVVLLANEGKRLGFEAVSVEPVRWCQGVVSSTEIRSRVTDGDVVAASSMLGRFFSIRGRVVVGDRRGRNLGFPTANVELPVGQVTPRTGVYALVARVEGHPMGAVGNIGMRPTFAKDSLALEVHILGFSGDLYGKTIDVDFVDFLRPETRFESLAGLVEQVEKDKQSALLCLRGRQLIENTCCS